MEIKKVNLNDINLPDYNPRKIDEKTFEKLKNSLKEFGYVEPVIINKRNMNVVGGNQRVKALEEMGITEVDAIIVDLDEKKEKALNLALNKITGEWDYKKLEIILKELDDEIELTGFDADEIIKIMELNETLTTLGEEDDEEAKVAEETEEQMLELDKVFQEAIIEAYEDFKKLGNKEMFISRGASKLDFLRALYFGKHYPKKNYLAYHPHAYFVKADPTNGSVIDSIENATKDLKKAGLNRTFTGNKVSKIFHLGMRAGVAVMPLDFSPKIAKEVYNKYGNKGKILDPCHGWGGRMVGFLLSDAKYYTGVDVSPETNRGAEMMKEDFLPYVQGKEVELVCSPFEDYEIRKNFYDLVFTSPPYFDTEKYIGGEQSYERYQNYSNWRDGFYYKLFENSFIGLKSGGYMVINVGAQRYPLKKDGRKLGEKVGFTFIGEINDIFNVDRTVEEKSEALLFFKK